MMNPVVKVAKDRRGFSVVELLIAMALGLVLLDLCIKVYLAQIHSYKTTTAQSGIQSAENAISALVDPIIRAAGFCGCASVLLALSNLNSGGPPPLGTLNTTPSMVRGYNANSTTVTLTSSNPANSTTLTNWTPTLDSSFSGLVQPGNDVVVVLGPAQDSQPVGVTSSTSGSSTLTVQDATGTGVSVGQYAAISDCLKATIFKITGITGNTISHVAQTGTMNNATSTFSVNYSAGAQFIPMQQIAFFVGQGAGGQSSLMRATLSGTSWTVEPLIPGINAMQVQYGIGSNGIVTRYVTANSVTDWGAVYAVRLSFLIEGQAGSGIANLNSTSSHTVLESTITTPSDNRLRHVYDITIHLRNST